MPAFEIYLSAPELSPTDRTRISAALNSNWIAPLGPEVDGFEQDMKAYLGVDSALALSSGTAALHLGLRAMGVGPGDHVLCSTLTFIGSCNPILYLGATPVFVDSSPETWNMCPSALEKAILALRAQGIHPKVCIAVSLYGQSADLQPIRELCDRHDILLLEDAAESLGATYHQRKSGAVAELSILSFNGNKIITTSGGGMLVGQGDRARKWIEQARFWSTQARDPAPHYEHSQLGYNYRLSNLLAALGRGQLATLEDRVNRRRRIFERYAGALGGLPGVQFMSEAPYGRSTRWLSVMTLDPSRCKATPSELISMLAEKKIEARPVWKPMHLQPLLAQHPFFSSNEGQSFSERVFREGICLPSGAAMTEAQQDLVISAILERLAV